MPERFCNLAMKPIGMARWLSTSRSGGLLRGRLCKIEEDRVQLWGLELGAALWTGVLATSRGCHRHIAVHAVHAVDVTFGSVHEDRMGSASE